MCERRHRVGPSPVPRRRATRFGRSGVRPSSSTSRPAPSSSPARCSCATRSSPGGLTVLKRMRSWSSATGSAIAASGYATGMVAAVPAMMRIVVATAALFFAAALPAAADTATTVHGDLVSGPVQAGASVLWMETQDDGPPTLLGVDPGASPVALATLSAPAGAVWPFAKLTLAASATTWAIGVFVPLSRTSGPWLAQVLTGSTNGGDATVLASCNTGAGCACPKVANLPDPPLVGASGDAVAYQDLCRPRSVVVHRPGSDQRVATGAISSVQFAGRYLAWQDDGYVLPRLYDLQRRSVIARLGEGDNLDFTI